MDTDSPAADLTASLLRSPARTSQAPPTLRHSPFCDKGEATADHFRHEQVAPQVAAVQPLAPAAVAAAAVPHEARLWLRVVPPLRWRLKLAAAVLGQTCQRFLVDALDAALVEGATVAGDPTPREPGEPRVKLAIWVDKGRRTAVQLAVAACDGTQQAFLQRALEGHLRRFAPSGLLLQSEVGDGAKIIAFPQGDAGQPRHRQAAPANLGRDVRNAS